MTTQESPADLARIKQAFVEILLRRKAEAQAAETDDADDPLDSVAALFAEPDEFDAPVAGSGYSPEWQEFLAMYGNQWNGKKETWPQFRQWIELFADRMGVMREALTFLAAAEAESDEAARIKFFARHGVTIAVDKKDTDKAAVEKPTTDADGRPVDQILADKEEEDGGGEFLWVRVAGETGKLYLKGRKFVAEHDAEVIKAALGVDPAELPAMDDRGRKVDEIRSKKAGNDYVGRIRDLWGRLSRDPESGRFKFTALYPDDTAYADWSTRVVSADGYSQGGTEYVGTWFRPWAEQDVYMLQRPGGTREWARGNQLTGNAPGSAEHTIAKVLKVIAKPHPDPL